MAPSKTLKALTAGMPISSGDSEYGLAAKKPLARDGVNRGGSGDDWSNAILDNLSLKPPCRCAVAYRGGREHDVLSMLNGGREMTGSKEVGPMVAVREFVEGFNTDDVDRMQAACANETSLIDDFAPHEWMGPGATTRWYREMARMATGDGMSDWSVTLDEPRHVTVSDRHAYVVVPVDVRWLQAGTPVERTGSMTVALREWAEGWRISACAWTWN